MNVSRAAAKRWLADRVGDTFDTVQVSPTGRGEWRPGPRVLHRSSTNIFTLNGSRLTLDADHTAAIDDETLTLTWSHPDTSDVIQTTTYTRLDES